MRTVVHLNNFIYFLSIRNKCYIFVYIYVYIIIIAIALDLIIQKYIISFHILFFT